MMNGRLKLETGELLFEKRGHKWALMRFAFDVYGESESDIFSSVSEGVDSGGEKA
jgi:hypothetical protein